MRTVALALLLVLLLSACGDEAPPPAKEAAGTGIDLHEGETAFGGFAISSGQPSEARLKELAPKVARVVNFRMPDEHEAFDEGAVVRAAGGTYASIPFSKETLKDPAERRKAYAAFEAAMKASGKPTWFHCSSGNRVGALWALYQAEVEQASTEEALAAGRGAGLTRLEPLVREILEAR